MIDLFFLVCMATVPAACDEVKVASLPAPIERCRELAVLAAESFTRAHPTKIVRKTTCRAQGSRDT